MKKKIVLTRFFHRGRWRIGIRFEFDAEIDLLVRDLPGRNFSSTNKCWYVDDSEDSLKEILKIFRNKFNVDISAISTRESHKMADFSSGANESETLTKEQFELENEDISSVKQRNDDDPEAGTIPRVIVEVGRKSGNSMVEFRINENDGRLSVRFTGRYDKKWIDEIQSFGRFYYDKRRKEFLLPWSQLTVDSLSDYFSSLGVEVKVIRRALPEQVAAERKDFGDDVRGRELGKEALEGLQFLRIHLEDNRYSNRTIDSYLSQLELYFKFFSDKDPMEITHVELSDFVNSYIIRLGFSTSFQNQMISAIKTFYEISGRGRIIPQVLERPRRTRSLPKVFSKEEVTRILSSARNDKHKLLLWMIYSCGLRRSEATNIRLTDLDRERRILHIREGKGMVDRFVPVSDKVWEKIDEYLKSFSPVNYLFEGHGGGRYSSESVYQVFKLALKKAGIQKEVGVHSLRHSYATHLHEGGLDIRYIQELLGHRSSRTTEIYTHVSRRDLVAVRSPIEDLDI